MNRRTALAGAAAISLSLTGIAVAAGATMHVFQAADASPNIGKVSPVSTATLPPEVEHHVVDVVDPPVPAPLVPAPASAGPNIRPRGEHVESDVEATPAPAAIAPAAAPHHEVETEHEDHSEPGDD